MSTQPTNAPTNPIPTEFPDALDAALADLTKTEGHIVKLREFVAKWKPALLLCKNWDVFVSHKPSITIRKGYGEFSESFNPKKIARAFGPDSWTRKKNSYTCGQIDWKKTVDGVEIEISGAEHMSPKLIEEVKL